MKTKELRVNDKGDFEILISFSKKEVQKLTEMNPEFRRFLNPGDIERLYREIVRSFLQNRSKFIGAIGFGDTNFSEIKIKCEEHDVLYAADKECPVCIAQSTAKRKEQK